MPFDGFVENTQVTERLLIGRARIEAGWCQHCLQRTKWTLLGIRHEYCLIGAVRVNLPGWSIGGPDAAADLLTLAIIEFGNSGSGLWPVSEFNDSHTKAEVLEVVDLAIAMSRGEGRPRC